MNENIVNQLKAEDSHKFYTALSIIALEESCAKSPTPRTFAQIEGRVQSMDERLKNTFDALTTNPESLKEHVEVMAIVLQDSPSSVALAAGVGREVDRYIEQFDKNMSKSLKEIMKQAKKSQTMER